MSYSNNPADPNTPNEMYVNPAEWVGALLPLWRVPVRNTAGQALVRGSTVAFNITNAGSAPIPASAAEIQQGKLLFNVRLPTAAAASAKRGFLCVLESDLDEFQEGFACLQGICDALIGSSDFAVTTADVGQMAFTRASAHYLDVELMTAGTVMTAPRPATTTEATLGSAVAQPAVLLEAATSLNNGSDTVTPQLIRVWFDGLSAVTGRHVPGIAVAATDAGTIITAMKNAGLMASA